MGAHPKAPSLVRTNGGWVALDKLIDADPGAMLGDKIAGRFQNRLPYLFKVLAAAKPLSIQAHPDEHHARQGFQRENCRGIELNAPERNYKDGNHKPECICALTPFWALCRFRDVLQIHRFLEILSPKHLAPRLAGLAQRSNKRILRQFFESLMTMVPTDKKQVIEEAVINAHRVRNENPAYEWIVALAREYPVDMGVFAPVLLNLIRLRPGQGLYLPAGEPHAYLKGVGIELMANSDNVLRGGLTSKHVDVPELLQVLTFRTGSVEVLTGEMTSDVERVYRCPVEEFLLSAVTLKPNAVYASASERSAEILLCTEGTALITDDGSGESLPLKKGQSVVVPAAVSRYALTGQGVCYRAAVPGTD